MDTYTITFTNGNTTTFTVTNGNDGEKGDKGDKGDKGNTGNTGATGNGISTVAKTGTSGLVDTYTITFTNGTTTTFTVTNGADGTVPIVTSWESTLSDSKVPSEKLAKSSLDGKVDKVTGKGLSANDFTNSYKSTIDGLSTVATSGSYNDLSNKPSIPSSSSDLSDGSNIVKKSSTTGLLKSDGSVMASGTGSSNWAVGNHTHSAYVNPTKVTSWGSTPSDDNVASEKLIKNSLDGKQATLVSGTNLKTINNESLLGSGNITVAPQIDIQTSWGNPTSDSKVASEKLIKDSLDGKLDTSITSFAFTIASDDNILITDTSDSNKVKRVDNILASQVKDGTAHSNIGSSANDTQAGINLNIDTALSNKVSKSSTTGLLKNDGSVMTGGTGSSNWAIGNHTHDDRYYTETEMDTALAKKVSRTKFREEDFVNPINWEDGDGNTRPTYNSDKELVWIGVGEGGVFDFSDDNQLQLPPNYHMSFTFAPSDTGTLYLGYPSQINQILSVVDIPYNVEIVCQNNVATVTTNPTTSTFSYNNAIDTMALFFRNGGKISNFTFTEFYPTSDVIEYNALSNIGTSSGATQSAINSAINTGLGGKQATLVSGTNLKTINNETLLGSGNIEIQGGSSVDVVTSWEATLSDTKVPSEKLTKNTIDGKLDNALSSTVVSIASNDDILITDYSDSNKIKRVANILASQMKDSNAHSNIGSSANDTQATINTDINTALGNKVSKSSTSGLLKNDGSVDTNTYLTSSAITGMLTTSDIANNLTTTTTGKVLDASQGKALADLIGQAITYINQ